LELIGIEPFSLAAIAALCTKITQRSAPRLRFLQRLYKTELVSVSNSDLAKHMLRHGGKDLRKNKKKDAAMTVFLSEHFKLVVLFLLIGSILGMSARETAKLTQRKTHTRAPAGR
jgi:hypothetical protein